MDIKSLFGYAGKPVVVSGGYSGMGYAAARLLIELGADVYVICRKNGRHSEMDLPVKGVLHADFGVQADLDDLSRSLPDNIFALFLCHGIALNSGGTNTISVQRVNFLGHKYLLENALHKVDDFGSVNIIGSTGGFNWESNLHHCMEVINTKTYEEAIAWYESHPEEIASGYVFSKQCLCAYVKAKVHSPEFIDRKIRLNLINPGNTLTGLTEDFNKGTSPTGNAEEGKAVIESLFLDSWNGYWASPEDMGYPLVTIGSSLFSYMSGQIIYFDYGMSSVSPSTIKIICSPSARHTTFRHGLRASFSYSLSQSWGCMCATATRYSFCC